DQPAVRITDLNAPAGPVGPAGPAGPPGPPGPAGPPGPSAPLEANSGGRGGPLNRGGLETVYLALNRVANGIVQGISFTKPANAERVRRLANAQTIAVRAVANAEAAIAFLKNSPNAAGIAAPQEKARVYELPAQLQGIDPG